MASKMKILEPFKILSSGELVTTRSVPAGIVAGIRHSFEGVWVDIIHCPGDTVSDMEFVAVESGDRDCDLAGWELVGQIPGTRSYLFRRDIRRGKTKSALAEQVGASL